MNSASKLGNEACLPNRNLSFFSSNKFVYLWILFSLQGTASLGRYTIHKLPQSRNSNPTDSQCQCNVTDVFSDLPYFLQELGRDEKFDWAFQGKRGEIGPEGPIGPPEPGPRGLPGTSLVFNNKGSLFGSGSGGSIGPRGFPGKRGSKGNKGEAGTVVPTVLRDGSYVEVKGQKGDRGVRGRKGNQGLPGVQGLTIHGQKGEKGEPAILPDFEDLRGYPGPRGAQGPPGLPGLGCRVRGSSADNSQGQGSCNSHPAVILQKKGDKGEQGIPGISLVGPPGPPGEPSTTPGDFIGTSVFRSIREMLSKNLPIGTIGLVSEQERAFIKVSNGWKEFPLGAFFPGEIRSEDFPFSQSGRLNVVDETSSYRFEDHDLKRPYYLDKSVAKNKYRKRNRVINA